MPPINLAMGVSSRLENLIARVKAGDQSAAQELLALARADHAGSSSLSSGQTLEVQRAREAANSLLGTNLAPLNRSGGFLNDFVANDLGNLLIAGAGTAIAAPVVAGALGGAGAAGGAGTAGGTGAAGTAGTAATVAGTAAKVGSTLGKIKEYAPLVLGGLGAINSASQQGQANDLQRQALQYAAQDYAARQPLRDLAMQRLQAPQAQRPDLAPIFSQSSNPYTQARYGKVGL